MSMQYSISTRIKQLLDTNNWHIKYSGICRYGKALHRFYAFHEHYTADKKQLKFLWVESIGKYPSYICRATPDMIDIICLHHEVYHDVDPVTQTINTNFRLN